MDNISSGKDGEDKAAKYLLSKGYKILERNFKAKRYGEIDIVAKDKNVLVFVEVKTRKTYEYGRPEEAFTKRKLALVARTGLYYKLLNPNTPELVRVDAVAVDEVENKITLFKNVTQ
ncbi:MAG: YraN family protein [Patescibacteria group bacterium]